MTITPELKAAIERSGGEPLRLEDPDTKESYVVVRQQVYERLLRLMEVERVDRSLYEFGEFHPLKS